MLPSDMNKDLCYCVKCIVERETKEKTPLFERMTVTRMIVCSICGNKRCPHSDDHDNPCTNSNDPEQVGSRYGVPK